MSRNLQRALLIGAAIAIVALGALIAMQLRADPLAEGYVLALMGISLLGVALASIVAPSPVAAVAEAPGMENKARRENDRKVDATLQQVVRLIGDYVVYNSSYHEKLIDLKSGLPQQPSRQDVQDVIVSLISKNLEMQGKIFSLADELEQSRKNIASLRADLNVQERLAMRDGLTGIGNRRLFDQRLETEIERARETGAELCLAMADIDRFKNVNDRFGHVVGDNLLKMFADFLNRNIRGADLAARFGGEEFALLLPETRISDATRLVDKMRRQLEGKRWLVGANEEPLGQITASFGVARLAADETAESFVKRADAKLYEAKAAGRNRIAVDERSQIENRRAVPGDALMTG